MVVQIRGWRTHLNHILVVRQKLAPSALVRHLSFAEVGPLSCIVGALFGHEIIEVEGLADADLFHFVFKQGRPTVMLAVLLLWLLLVFT